MNYPYDHALSNLSPFCIFREITSQSSCPLTGTFPCALEVSVMQPIFIIYIFNKSCSPAPLHNAVKPYSMSQQVKYHNASCHSVGIYLSLYPGKNGIVGKLFCSIFFMTTFMMFFCVLDRFFTKRPRLCSNM